MNLKDPENKKYFKIGVTAAAVAIVGIACYFLLRHLADIFTGLKVVLDILMPFIYGAVIAYVLAPMCSRFEALLRKKLRRGAGALAIVLSLLVAVAVVFALFMLVIPQVWDSIVGIAAAIPRELTAANEWFHNLLQSQPELQAYWDEISANIYSAVTSWLKTGLLPTLNTVVSQLGTQLAAFVGVIKDLFLGILISIYFLASRKQFASQAKLVLYGIFPARWAKMIEEEVHFADRMFNGFLMGKLLDSAIIGVLCFIGTYLMGFDSAALISVIVGVTNIIPFFGPFIGAIPCALLLLLENPLHCLYFLIFILILQQLDGNVIGPKIVGDTTGLPSFWVLFSILLFGGLWGVVGMVVGVPLFAVIYDLVRRLTYLGVRKHGQGEMIDDYNAEYHPPLPEKKRKKREKKALEEKGDDRQ